MAASLLTLFSYGIVAANKPLKSNSIEVTPMESLTMVNGELSDNLSTQNTKGFNADGAAFETTTRSSVTVTARWLPMGSNRKTSPDVRRGEKVAIWKYGDADKYYWSSLEYEGKLRKRETIVLVLSNSDKETDEDDVNTTYFLEISTHSKLVHFHTSTNDGEAVGYDFMLNTKDSIFQILDTMENLIFLDSTSKRIVLKTAGLTSFDLNDEDLNINVPRNMTTVVGGNMITKVGGKVGLIAGDGFVTEAPNVDFVTPKMTTSALFQTGGNASIGGSLSLAKGMSTGGEGGGDITINGNVSGNASATFTGRVKASNID